MSHEDVTEYLDELRFAGFDLAAGVSVEQYAQFPMATMAHGAAEELRREGFDVDVEPDEGGDWVAYVTRTAPPVPEVILRARDRVAAVAAEHGGVYDGWNLVPPEQGDEIEHDVDYELPD
jgi:hypothetical protein